MARDMSSTRISEAGPDLNDISSNPPLVPEPHFNVLPFARGPPAGGGKDRLLHVAAKNQKRPEKQEENATDVGSWD